MAGRGGRDGGPGASVSEQAGLFAIDSAAKPAVKDHRHGHRERLRKRMREGGHKALPYYELMELVLFRVFPRQDTKPLAKRICEACGSFAQAIAADENRLLEIDGVGERVIEEFRLIKLAAERFALGELKAKPSLSSWSSVLDYVRLAQGYDSREHFRVLFLDKKNKLIEDELVGSGTVDHVPVYVREVMNRALHWQASAIILVHNHPSGDPTPSRADIDMTKLLADAGKPLGVTVHDHIIVGPERHASLKALRLF